MLWEYDVSELVSSYLVNLPLHSYHTCLDNTLGGIRTPVVAAKGQGPNH